MKNIMKTVSLLSFAALFACSNNTNDPSSTTDQSTVVSIDGLVIAGTSDSAKVEILLADNYLKKVIKGNTYSSTPAVTPSPSIAHTIKTQVKITNFSYFNKAVDITCDKDEPSNKIDVMLLGSNELGHSVLFMPNSSDGLFYAYDTVTATSAVQSPEDEIEKASVYSGISFGTPVDIMYTFLCRGSDDNDYNVFFHGNYDKNNLAISSTFDFQTNEFTGVIGVSLKDYNDAPIYMFFDKQ